MSHDATIQKIKSIDPHTNADALEIATILGWKCVIKKGQFKKDELVVFITIDSICPDTPEFEFLGNNKRVRTIKLRGEISQGLIMPISIIPSYEEPSIYEGSDVSKILGVVHYEKPIPVHLQGSVIGNFPSHLIYKTDEVLLKSNPDVINEILGKPYYFSTKYDGTSATYIMEKIQESGDTKFRVCSRNQEKNTSDEENIYVKMAIKYNIEEILRNILLDHFRSLAIQAEIIGPGIQKNTCKLSDHEIRIFNIFDLKERRFFSFDELIQFKKETGLPIVNICESGDAFRHTIDELQHIANSLRYQESGEQAEGMVVRTKEPIYSQYLMSRLSFKVISENYLLKHNE